MLHFKKYHVYCGHCLICKFFLCIATDFAVWFHPDWCMIFVISTDLAIWFHYYFKLQYVLWHWHWFCSVIPCWLVYVCVNSTDLLSFLLHWHWFCSFNAILIHNSAWKAPSTFFSRSGSTWAEVRWNLKFNLWKINCVFKTGLNTYTTVLDLSAWLLVMLHFKNTITVDTVWYASFLCIATDFAIWFHANWCVIRVISTDLV